MPEIQPAHGQAPDTELNMLREAQRIESENPRWMVVFVCTQQFIAFPRFDAPTGTMAVAQYPGALELRMRAIEKEAARCPADNR